MLSGNRVRHQTFRRDRGKLTPGFPPKPSIFYLYNCQNLAPQLKECILDLISKSQEVVVNPHTVHGDRKHLHESARVNFRFVPMCIWGRGITLLNSLKNTVKPVTPPVLRLEKGTHNCFPIPTVVSRFAPSIQVGRPFRRYHKESGKSVLPTLEVSQGKGRECLPLGRSRVTCSLERGQGGSKREWRGVYIMRRRKDTSDD